MKIATWNCQGAFRKKAEPLARFAPDIAIIQECECAERLHFPKHILQPASCLWFGERATRGVGVFSYTGLQISLYEGYDPTIRYCVPLRVSGHADLHLLAVWAMGHSNPKLSYVGQLAQAITRYSDFLSAKDAIIAGDFNSNKQWDHMPRLGNHSWVVATLEQLGLVSVYHAWSGEAQGEESQKTLYMYRRQEKAYHIDYCFVPCSWMKRVQSFSVGQYAQWNRQSDHMPLLVEFADV